MNPGLAQWLASNGAAAVIFMLGVGVLALTTRVVIPRAELDREKERSTERVSAAEDREKAEHERADIERQRADALQERLNEEHSQIERAFDLIEAAMRASTDKRDSRR